MSQRTKPKERPMKQRLLDYEKALAEIAKPITVHENVRDNANIIKRFQYLAASALKSKCACCGQVIP